MGYRLANVVSVQWAHLPERQFKVLNRMALMALDTPNKKGQPAAVYFGGWEPLSMAMAREVPDEDLDDPEVTRRRKQLCDEASRMVSNLIAAGAVKKPADRARKGHQQSYVLTVS